MIHLPRVTISKLFALALTQIAAVKARPELEKGLTTPLSELEARLAKVRADYDAYRSLIKAAKASGEDVRMAMFEFSEMLKGNIDQATESYGHASAERVMLGGKPRNLERRKKAPVAEAATSDAPKSSAPQDDAA